MTAPELSQHWPRISQHETRRSRSFGGCSTCRARRVKCDEGRPTCSLCAASQLICSGYEKSIFFGPSESGGGKSTIGGPGRFRRHMLTEAERKSMSEAIRSGVPPSQALGSIAEIDDKCEAASSYPCQEFQITRGPFGAFRQTSVPSNDVEASESLLVAASELETLDPTLAWASPADSESVEDVPAPLDGMENTQNPEHQDDILPPTPLTTLAPCSPLSIGAILNNLDSPLADCSDLPWLPPSDFGRVQDVSDDIQWAELPPSPGPVDAISAAASLDISPSHCIAEKLPLDPRFHSIPPNIHQEVPHDAVFLLKHYSSTILMTLTPFQHSKTPWHVLFIPHVKGCLAALTLGESQDHATLCTFYATLALSASSVAGLSASDKWHDQSRAYKQHAHWHALCVLQTAYDVPKVAKYKSVLMSLLTMVQISTMTGDRDQAECFLLETEKFIRIKGLHRKKSRKVRLLHHCYAFERFMHESSWPGSADVKSAHRRRIRMEIESCGAGVFSQDSLDFALTPWGDLGQEMLRRKGQDEGENDLHLQIPGSWPATLYPEIFGVPEIHIFLLSMIIRLTKAKESAGEMSIGEFMVRAKSIERLIYQKSPYWQLANLSSAAAEDSQTAQCQRLLGILVRAMQEGLAIYFYRNVHDVHTRLVQGHVDKVCDCLRQIDVTESGLGVVRLLWPALVAAKEADDAETRSFFTDWFTSCARQTGAGIFLDTLARVQMVWAGRWRS